MLHSTRPEVEHKLQEHSQISVRTLNHNRQRLIQILDIVIFHIIKKLL